jgi:hypothetical protein
MGIIRNQSLIPILHLQTLKYRSAMRSNGMNKTMRKVKCLEKR